MSEDLSAVMAAIVDRLPADLADDGTRIRLGKVAAQLPAELVDGPLGLEIRLLGPQQIDVFAAAIPRQTSFAGLIRALRQPDGWSQAERAEGLAAALDRWQRGEGMLPAVARYLLVEADAPPTEDSPVPVPSIFLAPRAPHDIPRPGMKPNAFQSRPDVTTMASAELAGVWPDPATAAALAAVSDALPHTADVFAVGSMISRDAGASMRVAVRRLDPQQIHEVLQVAGLPAQAETISAYAEATCGSRQVVAFEIGPGAQSRVGLELSPWADWKQASLQGWPELLDELVTGGFAAERRAAAVPGLVDPYGDPLWGLAHVKVAADQQGMLPGSKLYVGLLHGAGGGRA